MKAKLFSRPRMESGAWPAVIMAGVMSWLSCAAWAQSPVVVTVRNAPGWAIPDDFSGLSFEAGSERPGNAHTSGYMFSETNAQLITLFQNLGLKNLRMGGGAVDVETPPGLGKDGYSGIDHLFAFAGKAGVKVIYSLRLPGTEDKSYLVDDANIANYIWQRYQPLVDCFAIGNEPDWKACRYPPFGKGHDPAITNYPSYRIDWEKFAAAITAAVPAAKFCGPDTGDYYAGTYYEGQSWTQRFADDERKSGTVVLITQHLYVGHRPQVPGTKIPLAAAQAIDNMLSPGWDAVTNQWLFDHNLVPVLADGLPYRLTESNDYLGGVGAASDAFAAALWALDYMHWWAVHGCAGVNFHNKQWLKTDTICRDAAGNYQTSPKGYGIKAFDLGSHGAAEPVAVENLGTLNLTAYAVRNPEALFVTIINREHGPGARAANVKIDSGETSSHAATAMFLRSANDDLMATNDITLGGAPITNHEPWRGQWTALEGAAPGQYAVTVPAASAAVVKIFVL